MERYVLFFVQEGDSACFEFLAVTRSSSSLRNKNDIIIPLETYICTSVPNLQGQRVENLSIYGLTHVPKVHVVHIQEI